MGGGVGRREETEAEMVNGTNKQINKKRRKEKKKAGNPETLLQLITHEYIEFY